MIRVLFVCMGNICRSPTAEGVFRRLVEEHGLAGEVEVDSAGTHDYHVGDPPDRRAQAIALRRGYSIEHLRGRQVEEVDFARFDYVLAMDQENLTSLRRRCPPKHEHKVSLLLAHSRKYPNLDVPDPYFGGPGGFELVLDMVEDAARGLIGDIQRQLSLR